MFQFKIISSFFSEKHHHSFFQGYVKTENRTHLTVRQNIRPFKRAASRVGIRKQKNKATDIHHQHHVGLTCLSVTDVNYSHRWIDHIKLHREDWQRNWRRSLTGQRGKHLGFILISVTWPARKRGTKTERPAKCDWPRAIWKGQVRSHLHHSKRLKRNKMRHNSQIKASQSQRQQD